MSRAPRSRPVVLCLLAAILAVGTVVPLLVLRGGGRESTPAERHEQQEERDRASTVEALRRSGRLTAPADAATQPAAKPPFPDSINTDGQAGSGGRAVAYRADGRGEPSATAREQAPEARFWRTGFGSWEPTAGIAGDGTIFVSARNTNVDPGVARSRDGGRTWDRVNPPDHKASLDPYVWLDPDTGSLFSSDIDAPPGACSLVSRSDDAGDTWKSARACGVTDHQNLFGGPPPKAGPQPAGYPNVLYYCAISGGTLNDSSTVSECLKSLDGGGMWSKTGAQPAYGLRPTPDGSGQTGPTCNGAVGHGVVGPDGSVYLPRAWCDDPHIAISRDEGATWKQVKVVDGLPAPHGSHETGVAVDRDGTLYYTWVAGKDHHPYLSISRDGGESWGSPKDVLPPGVAKVSAFTTSIAVGDPGKLAMVFMGTPDAEVNDRTGWNAYMIESPDALDADPTFYAAPANDPASNALWKGACDDLRCGNLGDFLDVRVGPDGTPMAALADGCPTRDDTCITDTTVTTPRSEGALGQLVGGPPLRGAAPSGSSPPAGGGVGSAPAPSRQAGGGCVANTGFAGVGAQARGRGAQLELTRRPGAAPATVDVFQQSRGRRVVGERLVARFTDRAGSFAWDGRATRSGRRVTDGYYLARFRTRGFDGRTDVRRVVLRRTHGRFVRRLDSQRAATCDLLPFFKLRRPVFGGTGHRAALGISYRLSAPAQVTLTVRRGRRVIRRFAARRVNGGRTVRVAVPAAGLRRGEYAVRLTATGAGAHVAATLTSRRL